MLGDISRVACELALQRFAASEQRLKTDEASDAATLYQRFCFLRGIILHGRTEAALATLAARPFVEWKESDERVPSARGMRGSSQLMRQLAEPCPRVKWTDAWHPALTEIPGDVARSRFDPSLDNVPNRFVRFVLEEWRARISEIEATLCEEQDRYVLKQMRVPSPVSRGLVEARDLEQRLDTYLSMPTFRGVGRLAHFPGANQVLQRRAGYRDIRELYALSEFAGLINWDGGEDVFGAGQRNVAALYEYWVFLQIAMIISDLTAETLQLERLINVHADGLGFGLKHGRASVLSGTIKRPGCNIRVELSFNREFRPSPSGGSWTRTMRPDCSLQLHSEVPDELVEPVSLHFDAKYRVGALEEIMGTDTEELSAHSDDLLKMHAYRDAILRAVGAFVIYPGEAAELDQKFGEIVPGLGAFPLSPGPDGAALGAEALRGFLNDAIDHVCARGSRRARATYWHRTSYEGDACYHLDDAPAWLREPPADTIVLLGYVKDKEHFDWIRRTGLYNLRADENRQGAVSLQSRELSADVVLLYGPPLAARVDVWRVREEPRIMTAESLMATGYDQPRGSVYFCLPISSEAPLPGVHTGVVRELLARRQGHVEGAPFATTFLKVMALAERRR
jgi:hypothetical protein